MTTKQKAQVNPLDKLTASTRSKLASIVHKVELAIVSIGNNNLLVGEHLSQARDMLTGAGQWDAWTNTRPAGLSRATIMRRCAEYRKARSLSPAVVGLAMAQGISLVSTNPKAPFGRYTGAVKAIGLPKRNVSNGDAATWLKRVQDKARTLNGGNRRTGGGQVAAVKAAIRYFENRKPTDGARFFESLFATILKRAGLKRTVRLT